MQDVDGCDTTYLRYTSRYLTQARASRPKSDGVATSRLSSMRAYRLSAERRGSWDMDMLHSLAARSACISWPRDLEDGDRRSQKRSQFCWLPIRSRS